MSFSKQFILRQLADVCHRPNVGATLITNIRLMGNPFWHGRQLFTVLTNRLTGYLPSRLVLAIALVLSVIPSLLPLAGPIAQAQIPLIAAQTSSQQPIAQWITDLAKISQDFSCVETEMTKAPARISPVVEMKEMAQQVPAQNQPKLTASEQKTIDSLIEQLKSDDWIIRVEAAEKLGEMGVKATKAVPALTEALGDEDWNVRNAVLEALPRMGEEARARIIPELLKIVEDKDKWKRYRAAEVLEKLKVEPISIAPALIEALPDDDFNLRVSLHDLLSALNEKIIKTMMSFSTRLLDDNLRVRKDAVLRLKSLVANMDGAVNALLEALDSQEWKARKTAVWTLGKLAQVAGIVLPALIKACGDENVPVRKNAAWTLQKLVEKSDLSVNALLKVLSDKNPEVRRQAALALGKIGQEARAIIPVLTTALADEPVNQTATWALRKIATQKQAVVPALTKALGDRDDIVQIYAHLALWRIDDRTELAVSGLINELDYNANVATEAAWALGEMGEPAIAAVPALIKMLEEYMLEEYQGVDASRNNRYEIFNFWQTDPFLSRTGRLWIPAYYWERRTVAEALGKILSKAEHLKMLEGGDWPKRYAAAKALGEFGKEARAAIPALIKASTDADWRVRIGSIEALKVVGEITPPVLSALEVAVLEDTETVRLAAKVALKSLSPATLEQIEFIQTLQAIIIAITNLILIVLIPILWLERGKGKGERRKEKGERYNF